MPTEQALQFLQGVAGPGLPVRVLHGSGRMFDESSGNAFSRGFHLLSN